MMIKPLSLKSNSVSVDLDKHHILSISEIMRQFQVKSPSHRPVSTVSRAISTKKMPDINQNGPTSKTTVPQCFDLPSKSTELAVSKTSTESSVKTINQQQKSKLLKEVIFRKITDKGQPSVKTAASGSKEINGRKKEDVRKELNRQKTVSTIIKELNKISLSSCSSQSQQIPALDLSQKGKFKRPAPLSDRCPNDNRIKYNPTSVRSSKNIRLNTKNDEDILSIKTCKNRESSHFFRKGSSASTMSILSKHTISMQHFDDYEQLFPKQQKQSSCQTTKEDKQTSALSTLEKVKNKIFQQITSLDKKLLQSGLEKEPISAKEEKAKPTKVICLKRKKMQCLGQSLKKEVAIF